MEALEHLCSINTWPLIADKEYGLKIFLRAVVFRESNRCSFCYHERLKKTAAFAALNDYSSFTSTLFYSKYQSHSLMKNISENLAFEYGITFYYQDFRTGWQEGIDMSIETGIYRQKYCGCIYSEQERFDNRLKKRLRKEKKKNV